ncbi:hypothetical protein CDAR_493471 [Caerostris darwini]|uniref:Uncharacterized protein n=1 Tax=Caerostris darwini TaxID=1538125 RepID=A0AAV4UR82_9ARAC|nr:hypothetical protein CDAR_493471 [Caerostris darwini]
MYLIDLPEYKNTPVTQKCDYLSLFEEANSPQFESRSAETGNRPGSEILLSTDTRRDIYNTKHYKQNNIQHLRHI